MMFLEKRALSVSKRFQLSTIAQNVRIMGDFKGPPQEEVPKWLQELDVKFTIKLKNVAQRIKVDSKFR